MRRITLFGLAFFVGTCAGSVAVYGHYQGNPVVCICKDNGGDVKWVGEDCPNRIKRKLKKKYGDQCPSP